MHQALNGRQGKRKPWLLPTVLLLGAGTLYLGVRSHTVHAPEAQRTAEQAPRMGSGEDTKLRPRGEGSFIATIPSRTAVSGRVQTPTGVALQGARVCVAPVDATCCETMSCTLTDLDGHFAVEHRGQQASTLLASRTGYLPVSQTLREPIGSTPVVLTLRAGGVQVMGSVVDVAGGPIAGAWLSAINIRDEVLASAVSDDAGLFSLDVASGVMRISARAEGYSEQVRQVRAPLAGLRLALAAASSIVGRAISEVTDLPVADVRVSALGRDGLRAAPRVAQTAPDGTFRLNGLPAGRYALMAVSERWRSEEEEVALGVAQVTEPIELILRAATQLTGLVKVNGVPCEQGSVSLNGAVGSYAALDHGGNVMFEGILPGRYQISVECGGSLAHEERLDIGLEPVTRVWELEEGLRVSGVAMTPGGAPLVGAAIEVTPVNEPFGRARGQCVTDEGGEFSCAGLVPGEYECSIGQGVPSRSDSVRVAVSTESSPRVVLHTHPEGAIRVRIENAEQFELPALLLFARGKAEAVLGELEGDQLVFEPLALGSYEITSDSTLPGPATRVELTREGQVAELTLALPSPHTLSGRVVDDNGQGIPDAWVRASSTSPAAHLRPATPVLTDAEGAFSLVGLVPGSYRLAVSSSQGEAQLDAIASDNSGVLVRVRNYGSLAVSLSNAAGGRVEDFVIAYRRSGDDWANEGPGSRGAWSVPRVAPGQYEVTAKAAEGTATQTVELPPGGEISLALRLDSPAPEPALHASDSSADQVGAGR